MDYKLLNKVIFGDEPDVDEADALWSPRNRKRQTTSMSPRVGLSAWYAATKSTAQNLLSGLQNETNKPKKSRRKILSKFALKKGSQLKHKSHSRNKKDSKRKSTNPKQRTTAKKVNVKKYQRGRKKQ